MECKDNSLMQYQISDIHTEKDPTLKNISELISYFLNISIVKILLTAKGTKLFFDGNEGAHLSPTEPGTFFDYAFLSNEPFMVEDCRKHHLFSSLNLVQSDHKINFFCGYPINLDNECRIGIICLMDTTPKTINSEDLNILKKFTRIIEQETTHLKKIAVLDNQMRLVSITNSSYKRDPQTQVWNKSHIEKILYKQSHLLRTMHKPFGMIISQVIPSRELNDDEKRRELERYAKTLLNTLRSEDSVGSWGNNQYIAIINCDNINVLQKITERIVKSYKLGSTDVRIGILRFDHHVIGSVTNIVNQSIKKLSTQTVTISILSEDSPSHS